MRGLGAMLLTGVAAVVLWKLFAAMFVGLLAMLFKAALVFAVVYVVIRIFQSQKKEE